MPTYEYRCKDCGHTFDAYQSFTEETLTECPSCGGAVKKLFGNVGISFKGSGFYKTDSRAGGSSPSKGTGSDSSSGNGSSTGDTPSKSDSSSPSKDSGSSSSTSSSSSSSSGSSDEGSGSSSSSPASTAT